MTNEKREVESPWSSEKKAYGQQKFASSNLGSNALPSLHYKSLWSKEWLLYAPRR